MALPTNGKISFSDLVAEFGGSAPIKLSNYYRGGPFVPDTVANQGIPTSGPLSFHHFYGASNAADTGSGTYYDLTTRLSATGSPYSAVIVRNSNGWVYSGTVAQDTIGYLQTAKEDGSGSGSYADTSSGWGTGYFRAITFNTTGTRVYLLDSGGTVWRFDTNANGSPNYSSRVSIGSLPLYLMSGAESPVNLSVTDDEKYISGPSNRFLYSATGATPYTQYTMTSFSGWPYDPDGGEAGFGNNNQFACVVSPTKQHIAAFGNGDGDNHAVVAISTLSGATGASVQAFYLETNNRHFIQGVFSPDGTHFFALNHLRTTVYIFRYNGSSWSQVATVGVANIKSIVALQSDLAVTTAVDVRYFRWIDQTYAQQGSPVSYGPVDFNPLGTTGVSVPFLRKYSANQFIAAGYTGYVTLTGPTPVAVYAGGLSQNVPYVQTAAAPQSSIATTVTIPGQGYAGTLRVHLAGTASAVGAYWSDDSKGGPQSYGETAVWDYQCLGDETSFSLVQTNFNAAPDQVANVTAPRLAFRVNGGVNDGKELRVGSGASSGSFGAAGCPISHASTTFAELLPTVMLYGYGSTRPYNSTINYSDSTSYPPVAYASYGVGGSFTGTYNGTTVLARFNTGGSSLQVGATLYNEPPVQAPSAVTSLNTGTRPGTSGGGLALVYMNDH
jgi:hypothetical protein